MKALIIDDDTDLCLMLKSVLSTTIPQVQYAQSIASGKELLASLRPDVLFLDNNLPDGQGLEMVKDIKSNYPSTFIVFITAVDSPKAKALEYGVDVFLEKPLTYPAIFQALGIDSKTKS